MGMRTVIGDRPASAWNGSLEVTGKAGRSGQSQQKSGQSVAAKQGFMDTSHGNDFTALSPPMNVRDWTANSGNPPMVTQVRHISSQSTYWMLFNHGSDVAAPATILYSYDSGILGNPGNLAQVSFVITCYPAQVQTAMAAVSSYMTQNPRYPITNAWVRGSLFTYLSRGIQGTRWRGTTTIGHTNRFSPNDFWVDFTNDP